MKRIALALFAFALSAAGAIAQVIPAGTNPVPAGAAYNSVAPTCVSGSACWLQVDVNGNLKTTSSGGGGGLSVVDQAAWTQGTSPFTPSGGVYNDSGTLTSGQQGTVRLNSHRAEIIDTDTSNSNLYTAITSAIAAGTNLIGAVYPGTLTTGSFVSGTTAAMTGTASTQVVAAVAAKRLYITRVKCNNSSGTATLVQIQDGSGGTVLDTLAAGATYGGEQGTASTPMFWTTSGNGLFAQDVTTSASVICTASGYSG